MPLEQSELRSHLAAERPIAERLVAERLVADRHEPALGARPATRSFPLDLPHVVVCTQDLARVSPMIQTLIAAGYIVTTYPSSSRLFPRLHKIPHPIELLVIDGSADVPFARSALLRARAAFADLPIVLLSHSETDLGHEAAHLGASRVVYLPLEHDELLDAAFSLAPSPAYAPSRPAADQPCC